MTAAELIIPESKTRFGKTIPATVDRQKFAAAFGLTITGDGSEGPGRAYWVIEDLFAYNAQMAVRGKPARTWIKSDAAADLFASVGEETGRKILDTFGLTIESK